MFPKGGGCAKRYGHSSSDDSKACFASLTVKLNPLLSTLSLFDGFA